MSGAIDARGFRDALACFATGVTIITARDADGEPVGMTASSFNSVSVDPPLVLWSVTKQALSAPAFKAAKHWAVHVLASDQIELSNRFATSGADKFAQIECSDNEFGVPILPGCSAYFECRAWQSHDGGDHWILIGEVLKIDRQPGNPLVFCAGSYATSEPIRPPVTGNADSGAGNEAELVEDLLIYQLARATRQMSERFHQRVSECGLTIPEWRMLASLHGSATREFDDLCLRTFIDPATLMDMVHAMAEQDLCAIRSTPSGLMIDGTKRGHDRVAHLFAEGAAIEKAALGDRHEDDSDELKALLRRIVRNTS